MHSDLSSPSVDEGARRRFEAAWSDGRPEPIESCLPPPDDPLYPATAEELVHIELEMAWKAWQRSGGTAARPPRVEDYLLRFPHLAQADAAQRLLRQEYEVRQRYGDRPSAQDYERRLPTLTCMSGAQPPADASVAPDEPLPQRLGRYRITAKLGAGAFGIVYRGHDEDLRRDVAIKVPHRQRVATAGDAAAYLAEARVLAGLDHPGIVPVYDFGRIEDGRCYVVSKFVEGQDLAGHLRQGHMAFADAVAIVAAVAEALHHAHQHRLVHRDVKPANVLLDVLAKPVVADFGLALREEDFGTGLQYAGTPAYMSPEQARGEGHRVDARSDIYSLGVILYEMLTGQRPFRAANLRDLLEEIQNVEPRPPRQLNEAIPRELDRICLKALQKRAADRYSTALDLAEDLRLWQATQRGELAEKARIAPAAVPALSATADTSSDARPAPVVPRGLRSFDIGDADFFLDLLPGPRGRDGLPEPLHFWKARVEATDAERTFGVGLLYGPSGCGKSSLVKAGLLPRLAGHVHAVYVEATAQETEARLRKGVEKVCPDLPPGLGLTEALARLRRGRALPNGEKVLLVLDQFEQWLHAHGEAQGTELVAALRQCDGGRAQALLLVRDDFWMAATRFMHALEAPLIEGQTSAAVDLFDVRHARKVLIAFGRAYGALPASGELSAEQARFVEQAVDELAQEGKVIPVRLALFAELLKGRPWAPATLRAVGGTQGVGVTFLEETFSSPTAPPLHRYHEQAARRLLEALLPEEGSDLKGHRRSTLELRAASGYAHRPRDFQELLNVLDSELRLVTPTASDGKEDSQRAEDEQRADGTGSSLLLHPSSLSYQLTHDYLVPSLRAWLTRKQKETRRGRTALRLAEQAALWQARPEARHLPGWWEWLTIRLFTHKQDWTGPQRKMMARAGRFFAVRGLALLVGLFVLGWCGWELVHRSQARALLHQLLVARTEDVPGVVAQMGPYGRWLTVPLREAWAEAEAGHDAHKELHLSLALLPTDAGQIDYLLGRLAGAEPGEVQAIREGLGRYPGPASAKLWQRLEDRKKPPGERLRAAAALAALAEQDDRWQGVRNDVAAALLAQEPLVMGRWAELLRPVRQQLLPALATALAADGLGPDRRSTVARLFAGFAQDQPDAFGLLESLLDQKGEGQGKVAQARRQANTAASLAVMGRWQPAFKLLHPSADPTSRSYLIESLGTMVEPRALWAQLEQRPEAPVRQGLLLALGDFDLLRLAQAERDLFAPEIEKLYRDDPDSGAHAAAGWLLQEWGRRARLAQIDPELQRRDAEVARQGRFAARGWQWYVNGQGQTFVIVPAGEAVLGERAAQRRQRIEHAFALAAREVTVAEFARFRAKQDDFFKERAPTPDCPALSLSWYEATAYCNWLSEKEGIPKEQWCYLPNDKGQYAEGMKVAAGALERTGYRLPMSWEHEYACRAGSVTGWPMGDAEELLPRYAWYLPNAGARAHPAGTLRPNAWGLFDMLGNLSEWCQEGLGEKEDKKDQERVVLDGTARTVRAGSFYDPAEVMRSFYYHGSAPALRTDSIGLRPARTVR